MLASFKFYLSSGILIESENIEFPGYTEDDVMDSIATDMIEWQFIDVTDVNGYRSLINTDHIVAVKHTFYPDEW